MRVSLLKVGTGAVFGALLTTTFAACLPNPEKDFDDYGKRAEPFNQGPSDAGGGIDAKPPEEAVEGLYYAACLTVLAYGNTDRVFNFYTNTKFVPAEGGGGTLSLTLKPLAVDPALLSPPPTVAEAGTVGDPYTSLPTDGPNVGSDGKFTLQFGSVAIPGSANPITGRDILIDNTVFTGRFSSDRSCAQLSGSVTKPTTITLEGNKNTCIMVPIKDGDPTPHFTYDQDFAQGCQ